MEKELKLNIQLNNEPGTTPELIIRHGEAPEVVNLSMCQQSGDVNSVVAYKDTGNPNAENAIVVVDYNAKKATVKSNRNAPIGDIITGELKFNPELQALSINRNKEYSAAEMAKSLKFLGHLFTAPEVHTELLRQLMNFRAGVSTGIVAANNNMGNKENTKKVDVNHDMKVLSFFLNCPVYMGTEKRKFEVLIKMDSDGGSITLWFESTELYELEQTIMTEEFAKVKTAYNGFVVVEHW